MQIYCPKCKTGYEIDEKVVPPQGRRLRCAVCQKVFKCMPEDLIDGSKLRTAEFTEEEKQHLDANGHLEEQIKPQEEIKREEIKEQAQSETASEDVTPNEATSVSDNDASDSDNDDNNKEAPEEEIEGTGKTLDELASDNQYVKDIFKRLSVETENLFQAEQEESSGKKLMFRLRKMLGLSNIKNIKYYIFAAIILLLLALYYWRYEITRRFPSMSALYDSVGIESVVVGEGLEFQNVVRREFEDDYVPKLEIKGFIANKTKQTLSIPTIRIELLDKDGKLIQSEQFESIIPLITAEAKLPFSYVISRPSPLSKYVYLTFVAPKK